MSWRTFSLAFRQKYEGGYRYLDRCGEFMLEAERELNFMPGEIKPAGAKMEMPERGIKSSVDAAEIFVLQELPGEGDADFLSICMNLCELANKHFQPSRIASNGFALRTFWPLQTADAALAASLHPADEAQLQLGKLLGMVPRDKRLDLNFTSGSMLFHVILEAITFEKIAVSRHNPSFSASTAQKERIAKLNKLAERFSVHLSHALMLDIDLIEADPPQDSLKPHFEQLSRYAASLKKHFSLT